ncbi:hypothetical protein CHS0354_017453 [Potamilus streckersoni]|uniref:Uncharacterized protein n=1 Tax=Potamilus streckersoni TaxID=2493646 RepID=A0AAE0VH61_9BIVA|nr:hypothetical protein CHS0354_017453 [Potamilus streckersoni]
MIASWLFWQTLVINPSEESYFYLSIVVMFAVLYNATFIILRAAYPHVHHDTYLPIWFTLDYLSDAIYIMDMFMHSRLGSVKTIQNEP